jgi:glycine/D-amino acid oxidase-like deaminating enzyme
MTSKSLWMDIDVAPDAEVLDGVHECDVAVIGSGIAGLSTAYELCKRGKSVIVIDRGRICGGMTSRTSAHLAPLCDDLVSEMTKIRGNEATKLFCDSQAAAVDRIEEIQNNRRSIANSGDSTAISFRAGTFRLISSTMTRSARSEPPSTE